MKKFLAILLGRLLPMGMTGAFLQTSYSPIKPALNAFRAATNALAGDSTEDSGAGGLVPTADARTQLDQIISDVKAKGAGPATTSPGSSARPTSAPNPGQRAAPGPKTHVPKNRPALPPPPPPPGNNRGR